MRLLPSSSTRSSRWLATLLALACGAAFATSACGGDGAESSGGGRTLNADGGTAGSGGSSGSGGTDQGGTGGIINVPQAVGLEIEPATVQIDVLNGVASPVGVTARVRKDDDSTEDVVPTGWSLSRGGIADFDQATSEVSAVGDLGGEVTLTAAYGDMTATSQIKVRLILTDTAPEVTPGDVSALDGATNPDPTASWLYPYDSTVFPQGLLPPRLMWNGYAAGDKMRVSVRSTYADYTRYFVPGEGAHDFDTAAWTQLTESSDGTPVQISVSRMDSTGNVGKVMDQNWRFATGSLRGSVYYWANSPGRVLRISPGAGAPEDFLAQAGVTDGCTTCHTVSANGNTLVLGNGKAQSATDSDSSVFDLQASTVTATARGRGWAMSALTPNGQYAVMNSGLPEWRWIGNDLPGVYDVATGAQATGTALDGRVVGLPAFAPDGSSLLFIEPGSRDLHAMDVDLSAGLPAFSNERKVALASAGATIAYPSVSPNGKWAVFHRGPYDTRSGNADLSIAAVDGSQVEIALDRLNGVTYPFGAGDRDRHLNYEPTFAPVASGGYFWVVFTSRRTLGNRLTGGADAVKQLWVAAIDMNPQAGQDPSHSPFWVPGQDPAQPNMRGFWALDPCRQDGESCSVGSDCCTGSCIDDPNGSGSLVCGNPGNQSCAPEGGHCDVSADCCQGECVNSFCSQAPPK
ncbi:MAG: hypothetical protein KC766_27060 [Myxococcales bacterium]|nr:hypothetical protein [Myxococcales bacterium]